MTIVSGYQDAWNTPGWTSQWGYLPNATQSANTVFNLTLPTGLIGIAITGTFRDVWGPTWGRLHFVPSVSSVVLPAGEVNLVDFWVDLRNGTFPSNFILPMPDTSIPGIHPMTWTWQITGRIGSANFDTSIAVPTTGPIDLSVQELSIDGGSSASSNLSARLSYDGGSHA